MASNSILANMAVALTANVSDFQRGMATARKELSGFKKAGEEMKSLGENMSKYLSVPLAGLAAVAVKSFGDVQALKKGLEAVAGSAEAADKQFNSLKKVAQLPGLGLEEAVKGSINLQAIGFSAEKAEKSISVMGNAIATVGGDRESLGRALHGLQQLANTDFPLGEDLNILKEAIPQITPLLKDAFGTARSEELQKLGVSSKQVIDVITSGLGKLPQVSGGVKNSFENLSDSSKIAFANIGEAINKNLNIEGIINTLADKITALAEGFRALTPGVQRFIIVSGAVVAAIGPVLVVFGGILTAIPSMVAGYTALQIGTLKLAAATKAWLISYGPLIIEIAAITAAIAGLVLIAKSIYDSWGAISGFFMRMWAEIKFAFADGLLAIIKSVNKVGSKIGVEFKDTENSLKSFANSARQNLDATPYVSFGDALGNVGQNISNNMSSSLKAVKGFFVQSSNEALSAADKLKAAADKAAADAEKAAAALKAKMEAAAARAKAQADAILEIKDALALASKEYQVHGDALQYAKDKAAILESGYKNLLKLGLSPQSAQVQKLSGEFKALTASMDAYAKRGEAIKPLDMGDWGGHQPINVPAQLKLLPVDKESIAATFGPAEEAIIAFAQNASAAVKDLLVSSFVSLGEAIGTAISGGNGLESFFDGILASIMDFAKIMGQQLILLGVGKMALDDLFAAPGGGAIAIAAGVALIGAASAVKSSLSKGPSYTGAGVSGARTSSPNYGNPSSTAGYGNGTVIFEISGDNLYGVLDRKTYRDKRFGG